MLNIQGDLLTPSSRAMIHLLAIIHSAWIILQVLPYSQQEEGSRIYIMHGNLFVRSEGGQDKLVLGSTRYEFTKKTDGSLRDNSNKCADVQHNDHIAMEECDEQVDQLTYNKLKQTYNHKHYISGGSHVDRCWQYHSTDNKVTAVSCTETQYGFIEYSVDNFTMPAPPSTSTNLLSLMATPTPTISSTISLLREESIHTSTSHFEIGISSTLSTSSIQTFFSSIASVNNTKQEPTNNLYLADPGEQCRDFCQRKGLFCSTSIVTGNSDSVFTNEGATCLDSETEKFWQNAYDPSFHVNGSICAGYVNVNDSGIECLVEGFNGTNVRRLCKCLISGDEDKFSPWAPWSACTASCNGGTQTRSRVCNEAACTGPTTDSRNCNIHPCPIHGGFSDWSAWSSCTVTCGGGEKSRTRTCTNPTPEHGGYDCFGITSISDMCSLQFCPVHGNWTTWTKWSACDKPCNNGTIKRWRFCTNPAPLYGGNDCIGQPVDARLCNTKKCPAENVTVTEVRFDYQWNQNMTLKGSAEYTNFVDNLGTNVLRVFNYSNVKDTYLSTTVNSLRQGSVVATFTLYFTGMDSFQILLLQEAIEDDKYLGKLKILGFNQTYNTTIVPSSAPLNFTLTPLSITSIRAEWKNIPSQFRNGNISGYILFYKEKLLRSDPYQSIATENLNVTLMGLKVFTEYTFRVLAYNEKGNGIATTERYVYTKESTPAQPPNNVTAKSPTGFTAVIEWLHIAQVEWNGVPVGTLVTFDDRNGHTGNTTVTFPTTSAVFSNLIPSTTYIIDVCEMTSPGPGPCQRLQVTTKPNPPSKSPGNVTIEGQLWHDKIRVSWGHILPKYVHGDLLGYKVVYTLIKIAGKTIVQSKTDVKVLHPSITNVTIAGLQANAQYVFQILAFNAYGDGVRTTISYGETCACPAVIYTNYAASAPYIYRDTAGNRKGLLVDILENATTYACSSCKQPASTSIDFVNNGKNGWAEKRSIKEMKRDIDNYIGISFPAFGSTEMTEYYGFGFAPVFSHPGVIYYIIKDSLSDQVLKMLGNVVNTWPIFLINILFITISGYIIWALEFKKEPSDFSNHCLPGVFSGMYWSFITMGTHGYGDLTPRGIASRSFAVVWILIGMINLAIFTGALTTAITATQVYSDPKMYGVEVAAVQDSAAYKIAIFRNAKVNTKANYSTIEDVAFALKERQVRGALVDIFSAASRSDLFLRSDIIAKRSIRYPSAYGFVLSGDMRNAAPDFREYLNSQADKILSFMEEKAEGLEVNEETGKTVSMFDRKSPFFERAIIIISALLVIFFIIGVSFHFYKKRQAKKTVTPNIVQEVEEIFKLCEESLVEFENTVDQKIRKRFRRHIHMRLKLLDAKEKSSFLDFIPFIKLRNRTHPTVFSLPVVAGPSHLVPGMGESRPFHSIAADITELGNLSRASTVMRTRTSIHSHNSDKSNEVMPTVG